MKVDVIEDEKGKRARDEQMRFPIKHREVAQAFTAQFVVQYAVITITTEACTIHRTAHIDIFGKDPASASYRAGGKGWRKIGTCTWQS